MEQYSQYMLSNLCHMYKEKTLTDVTLKADDVRIDCHRNVLAAASPYFRAMFVNPVKERDEREIEMHNIEPDTLQVLIGYIYTGSIELTNENVQDFLTMATMLELKHLIETCADYMIRELCIENCIELFTFSSHFACVKLKQQTRSFILEHFSDITEDVKFLDLDIGDFEDFISDDDISVEKEETVFEIIEKWTFAQISSRAQYFSRLFRHVRLPLLNTNFIVNCVQKSPLVTGDKVCQIILSKFDLYRNATSESVHSHSTSYLYEHSGQYDVINTTPRRGMFNRKLLVFSGGADGQYQRSLTAFDPSSNKNYLGIKPHPTFDFKFKIDFYQLASTSDNSLYFLGGIFYDDHHIEELGPASKEVYRYDLKNITWERKSDMKRQRCCFSVVVIENIIYAIGGKAVYPRGKPIDSVEFYDPENDVWNSLSPVPIGIYNHASCFTTDAIFIFGGKDEDDDYLDTVFRYDIPTDSWTLVTTQMPKPRAQFSAFTYKSLIYLVGGATLHENVLSVAIYDPKRNKWTNGQEFPEERKITSACLHDGTIFVCGGVRHLGLSGRRSRMVESRDLFKYVFEKDCWVKVVKLVQYGNLQSVASTTLNTKYLQESDFVSSL